MSKRVLLLVTVIGMLAMLTACGGSDASSENTTNDAATAAAHAEKPIRHTVSGPIGVVAIDVNGDQQDLSQWIGQQPTVVNFWGTWCPPCQREIPDLVKLYKEYQPQGVEIVSLALEREQDPSRARDKVKGYAARADMQWVMLMGARDMAKPFRLSGSVPTTIFYDKNGNEVERFIGMRDYETFKAAFDKLVG